MQNDPSETILDPAIKWPTTPPTAVQIMADFNQRHPVGSIVLYQPLYHNGGPPATPCRITVPAFCAGGSICCRLSTIEGDVPIALVKVADADTIARFPAFERPAPPATATTTTPPWPAGRTALAAVQAALVFVLAWRQSYWHLGLLVSLVAVTYLLCAIYPPHCPVDRTTTTDDQTPKP